LTKRDYFPYKKFKGNLGGPLSFWLGMYRIMFNSILSEDDPTIAKAIALEGMHQADQIELIASENIVSKPILEAQGSLLTNKYAVGYLHPTTKKLCN
jgi:serine hydroxymethyltransferase